MQTSNLIDVCRYADFGFPTKALIEYNLLVDGEDKDWHDNTVECVCGYFPSFLLCNVS
jgi:hypothetical protein